MIINVDGRDYRVFVVFKALTRRGELMEGPNSATAQNGKEIRDIIGTAYHYSLEIEPHPASRPDYDALFDLLSAPVDSHRVRLPYGQDELSFDAAVSEVEDVYCGESANEKIWRGMKVSFRPIKPQRPAGGAW